MEKKQEFIVNQESFIKGLLLVISKYVNGNPSSKDDGCGGYVIMTDFQKDCTFVKDGTIHTIIKTKNSDSLSFGCQFMLRSPIKPNKGKVAVSQIGFHFYDNFKRFCRAEWAFDQEEDGKLEHPQPHWHFDRVDTQEMSVFDEDQPQTDLFNTDQESYTDYKITTDRYHFVMQADWIHSIPWQRKIPAGITEVFRWAESCLVGVINEYNYAVKRNKFVDCYKNNNIVPLNIINEKNC